MLTILTGINTFVFGVSNGLPAAYSFLYSAMAMLIVLTGILLYSRFAKHKKPKQVSAVRIPK